MRVTRRVWRGLVVAAAILVVAETLFTAAAYWSMTRRGVPRDIAAQRLLLTRWLVRPLLPANPRIAPYTGGRQRYLGDLSADSPEMIDVMVPDALLGSRLGRNITAFGNIGFGDAHQFLWVTNDEGFSSLGERDFHYGAAPPPQTSRVMIVGGSTVVGFGAGTPDSSLPARVRSLLERHGSRRQEVINAGVPGYDSRQEFLYVASELLQYKPDLLIVYDGWNDQAASELAPSDRPAAAGANLFKTSDHHLIEERFKAGYSVPGSARMFAETIAARIRTAIEHTGAYWLMRSLSRRIIPERAQPGPTYDAAQVGRYEENLTNMITLAERHGARVALFLQPIMWTDGHASGPSPISSGEQSVDSSSRSVRRAFYADARPMFARLRERYQRPARVCVEDLSHVLDEATDGSYVDSGHLTGRGNEIVAAEMVRRLAACGVVS